MPLVISAKSSGYSDIWSPGSAMHDPFLSAEQGVFEADYTLCDELSTTHELLGLVGDGTPTEAANVGGLLITSEAVNDSSACVSVAAGRNFSALFTTATQSGIVATFKTPASLTDCEFYVGFLNSNAADYGDVGTQVDGAVAIYPGPNVATDFEGVALNGAGRTGISVGSGAVAINTVYTIGVFIDADRYPHFVVNGKYLGVGAQLDAATALVPICAVEGNAKGMYVRRYRLRSVWA